jgi:LmbE family N-acetylglucosaminyl deacetylase
MKEKDRRNFLKLSSLGLGAALFTFDEYPIKKGSLLDIPLGNLKKLNIVCVGAHPGDPEFGCGGTMAKYSDAGHNVTFLYLTRGEAGNPKKTYAESAALRTAEAETACRGLHIVPRFVGQIDGNTVLSNEKNGELLKILVSLKPDLVFTQWPVDAHMDHQVTGMLTLTSWVKMDRQFDLYFYEVNTGSETMAFTPTDYVDISNVMEKKKAAMYAHKTQDPENTYNSFFRQMEEFRGLEAGVKAAEAFLHFKNKSQRATIL